MSETHGGPWICLLCGPECDETRHRKIEEHERCSVTIGGQATPVVYASSETATSVTPPPIGPIDFDPKAFTHKDRRVYVSGNIPSDANATLGGKPRTLYHGKGGVWFCPLCDGDCIEA